MASHALGRFFEGTAAARALITEEGKYPDPPDAASRAIVVGLRGGATVLMVAAFEEFLRSAFRERLSELVAVPHVVDFNKLPERMRVKSIFGSLETAMGARRKSVGKRVDRLPEIRRSAGVIVAELIDPEALADIDANPNSETVSELFKGIDMSDVFGVVRPAFDILWAKPEANTFLIDKLDEIVRRRHVVAHTADALKVPRAVLPESLKFLECLATALDDALDSRVVALRTAAAVV